MENGNKCARNTLFKLLRTWLYLLIAAYLFSGCATVSPLAELKYTDGSVTESLSSNVTLSFAGTDRSISGSGVLMFRKPDQIRLVILSPLGSVHQEVFVHGEQITVMDSGNGIAFAGSYLDLPEKGDFSGWRHIHWLLDIDPPDSSRGTTAIKRVNKFGYQENAFFENGLLISKTIAAGGHVSYGKYVSIQGIPLPLEITYETGAKEKFVILLDDPEINMPFALGTFTPNLSKFRVLPLSSLK